MSPSFSGREKEQIRKKLLRMGKECFATLGLKKTSIADLTEAAGIAQGSFYRFFDSKEELFFRVLEMEEDAVKQTLLNEVVDREDVSMESLKRFLLKGFELMEESPILRRIYATDEYEVMVRKLPPDVIDRHIEKDEGVLAPLISRWQRKGLIINKRPELIGSVIRALFTLTLHKKEIGEEIYDETLDLLAELIAGGLVKKEGLNGD